MFIIVFAALIFSAALGAPILASKFRLTESAKGMRVYALASIAYFTVAVVILAHIAH